MTCESVASYLRYDLRGYCMKGLASILPSGVAAVGVIEERRLQDALMEGQNRASGPNGEILTRV